MECTIIPHRKTPSGVAKNYIFRSAIKDRLNKESINVVDEEGVLGELARAFPDMEASLEVCPEGFEGIRGLVLNDTRGTGALTPVCKTKVLTIREYMAMLRVGAVQ